MRIPGTLLLLALFASLFVVYELLNRTPEPRPRPVEVARVWDVDMRDIARVSIGLPRDSARQTWVKDSENVWRFGTAEGAPVDNERWGGGVPLILSGPDARVVATGDDAAEEIFGFGPPGLELSMRTTDDTDISVDLGEPTPDGRAYYLRLDGRDTVYAVDASWHDVLRRLVTDPPYRDRTSLPETRNEEPLR